ncbi:MAG: UDP-N-acetylmuramoylalanine--D-glutamate ligase [Francisellaceae bacterium]|nr:UDP-N-acetylmuramoylalanine--D-glutamate ligase [Francisellaceae bacterium]
MSYDFVVLGLGETGRSVASYLSKNNYTFAMNDTRLTPPLLSELKSIYDKTLIVTGGLSESLVLSAKTIVLSPGISDRHPVLQKAKAQKIEIISDIELFARVVTAPVIAITGSNGKSTVTTLVGQMINASGIKVGVGGNLGKPALDLLEPNTECYVLELSSFQLEHIYSLKPKIATILNVCEDHLDRYDNLQDYLKAKLNIYRKAENILVNTDELYLKPYIPSGIKVQGFGLTNTNLFHLPHFNMIQEDGTEWISYQKQNLIKTQALKILGRHNLSNALAALSIGKLMNLPIEVMIKVLADFTGLPHRTQWVSDFAGITWINDSKGTNVGATLAAIKGLSKALKGKWIVILGGVGKNADFTELKPWLVKYCKAVILLGESAEELNILLNDKIDCYLTDSLNKAVQTAYQLAEKNDGVLLSPACASYDMFKNFEHRGEVFINAVYDLRNANIKEIL